MDISYQHDGISCDKPAIRDLLLGLYIELMRRAQGPESRTENFYALTKTGLHKLNLENFFLIVLLVSLISSASMYVSETFQILQFWLETLKTLSFKLFMPMEHNYH